MRLSLTQESTERSLRRAFLTLGREGHVWLQESSLTYLQGLTSVWVLRLQKMLGLPAAGRCPWDLTVIGLLKNQQQPLMAETAAPGHSSSAEGYVARFTPTLCTNQLTPCFSWRESIAALLAQ